MRSDPTAPTNLSLDYVERINRAIDYILNNLDQQLQLDDIARIACYSRYHFHRIFQTIVGETLAEFVKRVRLERSLKILSFAPHRSIAQISLECGFSSPSDFSRSFKQRYGVPPSSFDVESFRTQRRQEWQDALSNSKNHHVGEQPPVGANPDKFVAHIRKLPLRSVAYIRVLDPYRPKVIAAATARLMEWAEARGLADGQWLGYMWDDPEVVAHTDCRYDVGLVAGDFDPGGEIGRFDFPAMQVVEVEVHGPLDLELRAIDWIYRTWLPTSGYMPAEQPAFEAWIGRPFAHGHEHFELKAQIPIERA